MAGMRVFGDPMPKGSLICRGPRYCTKCKAPVVHPITEDDSTGLGKVWRGRLEKAGDALRVRNGFTFEGPVRVEAMFVVARPKVASKRRWPHVKPDLDKLTRMLLDALTSAHVIHDDALVVQLTVEKCYPCQACGMTQPGVTINVALAVDPTEPTLIGDPT